jgi:hypothetical protein
MIPIPTEVCSSPLSTALISTSAEAVCGLIGMHSDHLEVRSFLQTLSEIRIHQQVQSNLALPSTHPCHRTPSRFGLKYLSNEHLEVQRFLLTLSSTYLYSPHFSYYQHHLQLTQQIPYLEIFHALNLFFHSDSPSKELNFIKCVHETGHLLLSHLHPFSIFKPISVFVSSSNSSSTESLLISTLNSLRSFFISSSHTLSKATDEDAAILLNSSEVKSLEYSRGLLSICLGGMAAEYVIYGTISPRGSDDDLKEVLKEIHKRKDHYFPPFHPFSSSTSLASVSVTERAPPADSSILGAMAHSIRSVLRKAKSETGEENAKSESSDGVLWIDDLTIQIISEEFHRAVEILRSHEKAVLAISEQLRDRMDQQVDIIETLLPLLPPKNTP